MTTAQYRQHIIGKLGITGTQIRDELEEEYTKSGMRSVLRRHNLLSPKCQAMTRIVYFKWKKSLARCGKGVTIWWDHQLGVPVCRSCAAKLNSEGTQRFTKVPSKKRKS